MSILHTTQYSGWARGHLLCRVEDHPGEFAVTFDDGPNSAATGRILDVLARHGARATFFMLGGNVRRNADLARRVVAEGHEPAVHGDNHWPVPLLLPGGIRSEVLRTAASIETITGVRPRFYRPPFGFMSPGQARFVRNLGFEPVLGDVYPEDPHSPGVERIVTRVMARLRGGSILILHDGSPVGNPSRWQTVDALEIILEAASRQGLRGTTVAEIYPPGTALPL
ncbi:MAG TPA: polysaccharide deacetylase family protein [Candidatus Eisenbacteria bacterium]|nr:polysaccharide deacetylase family protein [Candidatus Eisenbacteria bacterium]